MPVGLFVFPPLQVEELGWHKFGTNIGFRGQRPITNAILQLLPFAFADCGARARQVWHRAAGTGQPMLSIAESKTCFNILHDDALICLAVAFYTAG
jgi:hypothetical protein